MTATLREEINSSPDGKGDWVIQISDESEWGEFGLGEWAALPLPYLGSMLRCPSEILDKEYPTGYGSPDRPVWTAWTDNYVVVCTEYDGSTSREWHKRNPPEGAQ